MTTAIINVIIITVLECLITTDHIQGEAHKRASIIMLLNGGVAIMAKVIIKGVIKRRVVIRVGR